MKMNGQQSHDYQALNGGSFLGIQSNAVASAGLRRVIYKIHISINL